MVYILIICNKFKNMNKFQQIFTFAFLIISFINLVISCGMTNYNSKWTKNKQTNNNRIKRIIGGNNSYGWKYSWYCVLITVTSGEANCGSSLITSNYLLTAAHCFDEALENSIDLNAFYDVHMGVYNLCSKYNNRRQIYKTEKVIVHENYYRINQKLSGDIALLMLKTTIYYQYEPICLPKSTMKINNIGQVIGFGVSQSKWHQNVCVLQETTVKIYSRKECLDSNNEKSFNYIDTFCAGINEGGIDACQGDSGGPLQVKSNIGTYSIIGIVSFGVDCGLRKHPGIYTNVSFYNNWISEHINV